ncbi:hypothetical protein LINPERHAP1_LOCUS35837, partial [Linum perenne]
VPYFSQFPPTHCEASSRHPNFSSDRRSPPASHSGHVLLIPTADLRQVSASFSSPPGLRQLRSPPAPISARSPPATISARFSSPPAPTSASFSSPPGIGGIDVLLLYPAPVNLCA